MESYGGEPPFRLHQTSAVVSHLFENGLVERVEKLVQKQVELVVGQNKRDSRGLAGTEKLDLFDPDNPSCNIEQWILTYDTLGERYGWSDYEKIYLLKNKLLGRARDWYSRLDMKYPDMMWNDWKKELWKAFAHEDFGANLEELVARCKMPTEPMEHYFHDKITLCERCEIDGSKAVSCIIRGLPEELRPDAYALKCRTPEALFSEFMEMYTREMSKRGRFSPPRDSRSGVSVNDGNMVCDGVPVNDNHWGYDTAPMHDRFEGPSGSRFFSSEEKVMPNKPPLNITCYNCHAHDHYSQDCTRPMRCFNCQEYGHKSKKCPKPSFLRCIICRGPGHTHENCRSKKARKRRRMEMDAMLNPVQKWSNFG